MHLPTFIPTLAVEGLFQRMFFGKPSTTSSATATDGLFMFIWWHGVFWFVLLMGLMIYFVIKYRRRPGRPAQVSPSHNTPLEVFWTVVPSAGLLVIFILGFRGYMTKVTPAGQGAIELSIVGKKWDWLVTYPGGETPVWTTTTLDPSGKSYPVYAVPEDTDINLRMISQDVIHSYWIPELRTKMDVYPNRYTGYSFRTPVLDIDDRYTIESTGEEIPGRALWVFCAEYCGDQHSQMAALMLVVPRGTYDRAVESWGTGDLTPAEYGERIYKQQCATCHSVDGSRNVGPTWKSGSDGSQQYGYGYPVTLESGQEVMRDDNYFRNSVLEPQSQRVAGGYAIMSQFSGFDEDQLNALLAYYKSLSDRGGSPEGEDADGAEGEGEDAAAGDESASGDAGEAQSGENGTSETESSETESSETQPDDGAGDDEQMNTEEADAASPEVQTGG